MVHGLQGSLASLIAVHSQLLYAGFMKYVKSIDPAEQYRCTRFLVDTLSANSGDMTVLMQCLGNLWQKSPATARMLIHV